MTWFPIIRMLRRRAAGKLDTGGVAARICRLSTATAPMAGPTISGILGEPGVAALMFAALERGSHVSVDLADKWDYWRYVDLPLAEARERLQVPLKSSAPLVRVF
jgi:hypothetical protein